MFLGLARGFLAGKKPEPARECLLGKAMLWCRKKVVTDSSQIKGGTAYGFAPIGTTLAFLAPRPYNFRTTWW
jgi:hypothetical protein